MNENTRFMALAALVGVGLLGAFALLRGYGARDTAGLPDTPTERAAPAPTEVPAHETDSHQREGRLMPAASAPDSPQRTPRAVASGAYAISGQVLRAADASPVADATVAVYPVQEDQYYAELDKGPGWTTRTNERGMFRVAALPAGRFALIATKDSLAGVTEEGIDLREPEDVTTAIEIGPTGHIAGHVRNEAGEPLADAFVVLGKGTRDGQDVHGYSQAMTRADGSFRLEYVPEGNWSARAKADGYAYGDSEAVALNSEDALVVLKRGGSVSGRVTDANTEKPVPDVALRFGSPTVASDRGEQTANTDAEGRFTFRDLADAEYSVWLYKQPWVMAGQQAKFTIEGANHVDSLELRVMAGGVITGRATDAVTGAAIPGMQFSTRGPASVTASTDDDGVYRLEGLPAGNYVVRRRWMPGYRHSEDRENKSAMVQLGQETSGIDFAVPPGLNLRGRVVDENGAPLALAEVSSESADTGEGDSMRTDERGRWTHRGFSPKTTVTIMASKTGYYAKPIENIAIPEHDLDGIEIVMTAGGTVAGMVVDRAGRPVQNASVVAKPVAPVNAELPNGYTRENGEFTIDGLPAGTYTLSAAPLNASGDASGGGEGVEVRVAKGERVAEVRLVLDMDLSAVLAGRVVDSSNRPIPDANVSVETPSGGTQGSSRSDADGHFDIPRLATGTFRLAVNHKDYTTLRTDVTAPDTGLTLKLRGKANIQGRVVDARSGQPLKAFTIAVESFIDASTSASYGERSCADEDGRFEQRVDEGDTALKVSAKGYAPAAHKVPGVRAEQTVSGIEIRLEPGCVVEGSVTDQQGMPIAGAGIWVNQVAANQWEYRRRPPQANTDGSGQFRIDSLSTESITIITTHPDFLPAQETVTPLPGRGAHVKLVMGGGGGLEGCVRMAGKPVAGYSVSVYVASAIPQVESNRNTSIQTDEAGMYSFATLPAGEAQVQVKGASGTAPNRTAQRKATILDGQVTLLDIDLEGGGARIEGTVTREGKPVANASVNVVLQRVDDQHDQVTVQTDAKGAYRIAGLPVGPAAVSVFINDSNQSQYFNIELESDRTLRLDVPFAAAVHVTGRIAGVTDGVGVRVTLFRGEAVIDESGATPQFQGDQAKQTWVQGNGAYDLNGVEAGEYTLVAVVDAPGPDGVPAKYAVQRLSVDATQPVKLDLELR